MTQAPIDFGPLVAQAYAAERAAPCPGWREQGLMHGFPPPAEARVSKVNFLRPPFVRWSFQHIQRLLPTIDVPAGTAVRPLVRREEPLGQLVFRSLGGAQVTLDEHLKASHADGFIVLQDGAVRYEAYANGQTPETRHIMFSVTKSLIGTLAEALVAERRLDEHRLTMSYVDELRGSAFGDATVRQLMDMAIGVHYTEDYEDPLSESSQFGYASGLHPPYADLSHGLPPEYAGLDSLYAFLPRLRKKGEHGGFFNYVTAVTEVLAWVMERATGEACHEQLARLWRRLGCERDGHFIADPLGRGVAGAGFSATLRDMARFGQMLLDHGRVGDEQLLPPEVVSSLLAGGDPEVFARNPEFAPMGRLSYKSQWYVFNGRALLAIGIHGQQLYVDFETRMVSVKQASPPHALAPVNADSLALMHALSHHYREGSA